MGAPLPPPRCLREVIASPVAAPDILLDTYTESPNRFFGLSCCCGETRFSISGEIVRESLIDQDVVVGPVTAGCRACGRRVLLFDPRLHGYDVELDHFPPKWEAVVEPEEFECPMCKGAVFALTARFEYPARLLEALESGLDTGYDGQRGREEDLFTFFTLIGRCSGCDALATISSHACA